MTYRRGKDLWVFRDLTHLGMARDGPEATSSTVGVPYQALSLPDCGKSGVGNAIQVDRRVGDISRTGRSIHHRFHHRCDPPPRLLS